MLASGPASSVGQSPSNAGPPSLARAPGYPVRVRSLRTVWAHRGLRRAPAATPDDRRPADATCHRPSAHRHPPTGQVSNKSSTTRGPLLPNCRNGLDDADVRTWVRRSAAVAGAMAVVAGLLWAIKGDGDPGTPMVNRADVVAVVLAAVSAIAGALSLWPRSPTSSPAANSGDVSDDHLGVASPVGRILSDRALASDAFALDVHRAIDVPSASSGPYSSIADDLPVYVPRAHDQQFREATEDAVGGRSRVVVLVGGSSTGKTRACWEALQLVRAAATQWWLWHPINGPRRSDAVLEDLPRVGPRTVIWLNEAQQYLLTGDDLGDRVAGGLRELLNDPDRAPVLVLATLWPSHAATLAAHSEDGSSPFPNARALLAAGTVVRVPGAFTGQDLDDLRAAAARDPRLAHALQHAQDGEIAQYLAGAPALVAHYEHATPEQRAVIETAMDARRLGHGLDLPEGLLAAAAPGYLTTNHRNRLDEGWFSNALAYSAKVLIGDRGALTRSRPREAAEANAVYRLADYLEQHGDQTRRSTIPPAEFWAAARDHGAGDRVSLARAAVERGRLKVALNLSIAAAQAGDPTAARMVADILSGTGETQAAWAWYELAACTGDPVAHQLITRKQIASGSNEDLLSRYPVTGDAMALDLARGHREAGRIDDALTWYTRAAGTRQGASTAIHEAVTLLVPRPLVITGLFRRGSALVGPNVGGVRCGCGRVHGVGRPGPQGRADGRCASAGRPVRGGPGSGGSARRSYRSRTRATVRSAPRSDRPTTRSSE